MKNKLRISLMGLVAVLLLMSAIPAMLGQANLRQPTISSTGLLNVTWTAGTLNNGGHAVSISAGTLNATANKTDCAAPTYTSCDFLYSNSSGTGAHSATVATVQTAGNILMAIIETSGTAITKMSFPLQNGQLFTNAIGFPGSVTSIIPATAGNVAIGSTALPFSGAYIGTAATNNIFLTAAATAAARSMYLTDPGAAGAFSFGDPSDRTKILTFDLSGQTAARTLTLASSLSASRTVTFTDPGGAANVAYANPTTAQALTNLSSLTSSGTDPADAGILRLANAETVAWENSTPGTDITLAINSSNSLVLSNATAPTDGYYFVSPGNCGLTLTTGTWAANVGAGTGAAALASVIKAQTGNAVLQGTTSAAANTFDMTCDFTPPSRLTANKGITILDISYLFGYQTTALTSIGTAATNSITYGAAGAAAAGTVASIGGSLTVTAGTNHGTPGATTTSGSCFNEKLAFGTPYAVTTDLTRLAVTNTFVQSAASSTIFQVCGVVVHYSNINSL
jgi:hypothetical protein